MYIHNISPLAISKQIQITSHPINHCPLSRTSCINIMISVGASEIEEKNCSEDCSNTEPELCLGHTGEIRGQSTFTVKRSTSEARRARRAKLTGSKLIKKYKQAELVKIVKLGELSL